MASSTRWIAGGGVGLSWSALAFTAGDLNSLASGGGALSTTVVANGTPLDLYADVSLVVATGGTTLTSSLLALYLLPLNQDGSTYGDSWASSATTQPSAAYLVGSAAPKVGVTSGNTITAYFRGIVLPPTSFVFALGNSLGVALYSTAALTAKYITYNENLNA